MQIGCNWFQRRVCTKGHLRPGFTDSPVSPSLEDPDGYWIEICNCSVLDAAVGYPAGAKVGGILAANLAYFKLLDGFSTSLEEFSTH